MLKKITLLFLCFVLILALPSCGPSNTDHTSMGSDEKIRIVATIFPIYDWVNEITGDNADVELLMSNGVDLHSFQPSVDDIIDITDCDVFIYVGGTSDSWVNDVLMQSNRETPVTINLIELLGDKAKEEEAVPGMQEEDEDDHHDDQHHTGIEYDEHVWLSLKNADIICEESCNKLGSIDPENS